MFNRLESINHTKSLILIGFILVVLTLTTSYYGSTDLADYSDTARYFAGNYAADIRSSHSYLYGFIHAPLIRIFDSFFVFKITSLLILGMLVYSVYCISGKDRRAFALMLLSPVVWYMAPWISPIQLASLCMLWAYYWVAKYDETTSVRHLLYAGALIGLGLAMWDTILFFGAFLLIPYLWNKKAYHLGITCAGIIIGLLPRLVLDYTLFAFPFFSLLKSFFGTLTNAFFLGRGSAYAGSFANDLVLFALIALAVPFYFWQACTSKSFISKNKKILFFIVLSLLLIFINPQIRYTLTLVPIITVLILPHLSQAHWRKQILISSAIIVLFIAPTALQTMYSFNESEYYDITEVLTHLSTLRLTAESESQILARDLEKIEQDYPHQRFIVFGQADYYQKLAHLYWGENITEFVSVQDYVLWQKNETTLFEKKLTFIPLINDRRAIWVGGGIFKNPNEDTDYDVLRYGIAFDKDSIDPAYETIQSYEQLIVVKSRLQ